jgi:hypothetical protein
MVGKLRHYDSVDYVVSRACFQGGRAIDRFEENKISAGKFVPFTGRCQIHLCSCTEYDENNNIILRQTRVVGAITST